jgi:formylglycine-generating enzyme required for sulfatase activity
VGQTATVGSYAANAFGLHDMCGNVAEWCLDSWDGSANYAAAAATDPYVTIGNTRIVRGGSWGYPSYACRSATRTGLAPTATTVSCGFRVVLAPAFGALGLPLPDLVGISPGSFMMGSSLGASHEQPVHQVQITRPFWIGRYEVTQAQYQSVMGPHPSNFPGDNRPVEEISWTNAMAYCAALTSIERTAGRVPVGYEYRLPTDAEWEFCCRAGSTTEWNTGNNLNTLQANFNSAQTVNVGSYAANALGLFDMHGNVWEWCLDSWDGSSNYPSSSVADPYVNSGPYRVFRGGSWGDSAYNCRSAFRYYDYPGNARNVFGFRVALAPVLFP